MDDDNILEGLDNYEELDRAVQSWVNQQKCNGHHISQQEIKRHMTEIIETHNNTPDPTCHGFTPDQMSDMLYSVLEEGCPVQLRHLTEEEISRIPFMRQVLHLMNTLAEKELKLTGTDKLPIKMVKELYELGVKSLYSEYYNEKNKFTEQRCLEVMVVRTILEGSGLIKKRLGKLSLTARGKKLLKDHYELLKHIIIFIFTAYNTACLDGYPDQESGNTGLLFSLWLLHHYGGEWRPIRLYAHDYYEAFDFSGDRAAYSFRVFDSLFRVIGLCEIREIKEVLREDNPLGYHRVEETRKTPIIDMMFSFVEPAKI